MNELIAQLLAALAALSAVTGSPADANKLPDRPVIVQSAPAASKSVGSNSTKPSDDMNKTLDNSSKLNRVEIEGTLVSVKTNGAITTITIGDQTITVDAKTKVEGKLVVGAKVEIQATHQTDGSLVASQVEVKQADAKIESADDKSSDNKNKGDTVKHDDKSGKSDNDDSKSDDKSGKNSSGDDKSGSSSSGESKSGGDKSGSSDKSGKSGGSDDGSGHH